MLQNSIRIGLPSRADILHNRDPRQICREIALKAAENMSKKPALKMTSATLDAQHEALIEQLCGLALDLAEQEDGGDQKSPSPQEALSKLIRKSLQAKQDDILYEAIERARDTDLTACALLKASIEEAAETSQLRRGTDQAWEAHAFAIPVFVRSLGGLDAAQDFQDQPAFELLTASFKQLELESSKARVVLINHAYHADELDAITYSELGEMLRESAAAMTDKKVTAAPAIERSLRGWPARDFAAGDTALELRFLLGFVLSRPGDPFYAVPPDEAQADAWFAERARRFREWSVAMAPVVQRCLVNDGRDCEISFLYQDLFHGAKARGMTELALLQMMAQLDTGMQQAGVAATTVHASVGIASAAHGEMLQVRLYAGTAKDAFAEAEKPFDALGDVAMEIEDVRDALETLGIADVRIDHELSGLQAH